MNALLLAATLASAPAQAAAPAEIDLGCYRLMADLARAEDPAVRMLGITAAHYFLGRIDSAAPGFDVAAARPVAEAERPELLRRCTAALSASGFDPGALGASLDRPRPEV